MENVKKVIFKTPVPLENAKKAEKLLLTLKMDIDVTSEMAKRNILTRPLLDKKIKIWNNTYEEMANLMGFMSFEDMQYYNAHFINL